MALYLPQTDTLVLEVPKTGSKWLRMAIVAAGVVHQQVGPADWRGHGDLSVHTAPHSLVACFVRDPLTWYRSYFAWRTEHGWRPHYELDRLCSAESFTSFVRSACSQLPGFLGGLYQRYTGSPEAPIGFIGRTESLADDLVRLLTRVGEHFDEQALRSTPRVNVTTLRPEVSVEIADLIYTSEFRVIGRFGYDAGYKDPLRLRMFAARYPDHIDVLRRLALWAEQDHWTYDDARTAGGSPTPDGTRHARNLTNFGLYTQFELGDADLAGMLYRQALTEDPQHPRTLGTLAIYLAEVEGDVEAADRLFTEALRVRPRHQEVLGNYALFQKNVRANYDLAEDLFRRALAANPNHARNVGNYAVFLHTVREDFPRAEIYYRKAMAADPDRASFRANYAELQRAISASHSRPTSTTGNEDPAEMTP